MCEALGLNPLGLLASGALVVHFYPPVRFPALLKALEEKNIDGFEIGQMLAADEGLVLIGKQGEIPLPQFLPGRAS